MPALRRWRRNAAFCRRPVSCINCSWAMMLSIERLAVLPVPRLVALAAQPPHHQRLRVVVVMRLNALARAASLARLRPDHVAHLKCVTQPVVGIAFRSVALLVCFDRRFAALRCRVLLQVLAALDPSSRKGRS